jgi:methyl-accepting chemotaxis protein
MRLRAELAATVLSFVVINLLLVFSAIGLFVRMGPAIDRILTRNDATIVAAESILEVLARSGGARVAPEARDHVRAAVDRARNNITEPGEEPVLSQILSLLPSALEADPSARVALVEQLRQLIAINRSAMRQVDHDAQRLGRAGAWAAMFVGLATLTLSLFLTRSLGRRIVRPIAELCDTLHAYQSGDWFRRCGTRGAAPELRQAMDAVNQLLDATAPPIAEVQEGVASSARATDESS